MAIEVSGVAATELQKTNIRAGIGAVTHHGAAANEAAMVALASAVVGDACTRTDTGTVWILKAAPYSTAGNWQDTGSTVTGMTAALTGASPGDLADFQQAAGLYGLDPVTMAGNIAAPTIDDHCNRLLINSGASNYTITLQNDATMGTSGSEIILAVRTGSGNITIAAAGGVTLLAPTGRVSVTVAQGDYVGVQRVGVSTWVLTEASTSAGASSFDDTFARGVRVATPAGWSTSTWSTLGCVNPVTLDSSTLSTSGAPLDAWGASRYRPHIFYTTAAAAVNRTAGWWNDGSRLNKGGSANASFPFTVMGGIGDAFPTQGAMFMGLAANAFSLNSGEPSAGVDIVGVGFDSGDTNMQIFHNDGTGAATKIDLGAGFPRTQYVQYKVRISKNTAGTTVTVVVTNMDSGDSATQALSTNIPAGDTLLEVRCARGSRAYSTNALIMMTSGFSAT